MHLKYASDKRKRIASALTFFVIPLSGFMTDIYLPSFPSMAKNLQVSEAAIQLTLTCFFLSYGIAQLLVGSILDSIGRYKPVLISLIVLVVSSLAIVVTREITLICLLRIVQGIATSFIVVAKRAFFVDLYENEKRKHYLSYFTIVWSCGPILAPFIGGYLEHLFQWQANFYLLAGYTALLFGAELLWGGETLPLSKEFRFKKIAILYLGMLKNKAFLIGIVALGLSYSVVMIFNISGPFMVEHHFHYNSVVIGYCTLILGIAWMLGGMLGKKFTPLSFDLKIKTAFFSQLILMLLLLLTGAYFDNLFLLIAFAFIIHICSGLIFTIFFTENMLFYPKNSGIAGGLMGGFLYIITSIASFFISTSGKIETISDITIRYFSLGILLFVSILLVVFYRHERKSEAFIQP